MLSDPFVYQRRIAFGDCDPARIYYTPRAIDYAVEAIERWCEKVFDFVWGEDHQPEFNLTFVRIVCDYLRPLVAGQGIQMRVSVDGLGQSHITFTVWAQTGDGDVCFQANLVACFVNGQDSLPLPVPEPYREKIVLYMAQFHDPVIADANRSSSRAELGDGESERFLPLAADTSSSALFMRRRRVICGVCGSAGVIYAPRVFDYAVEAIEEWFEVVAGVSWMELVCERGQGAPFVAAGCEFLRPITPGLDLSLIVQVTRLGVTSIGFAVTGHGDDGATYFQAQLSACFIDHRSFMSTRIPQEIRLRVKTYMGGL